MKLNLQDASTLAHFTMVYFYESMVQGENYPYHRLIFQEELENEKDNFKRLKLIENKLKELKIIKLTGKFEEGDFFDFLPSFLKSLLNVNKDMRFQITYVFTRVEYILFIYSTRNSKRKIHIELKNIFLEVINSTQQKDIFIQATLKVFLEIFESMYFTEFQQEVPNFFKLKQQLSFSSQLFSLISNNYSDASKYEETMNQMITNVSNFSGQTPLVVTYLNLKTVYDDFIDFETDFLVFSPNPSLLDDSEDNSGIKLYFDLDKFICEIKSLKNNFLTRISLYEVNIEDEHFDFNSFFSLRASNLNDQPYWNDISKKRA